jgi:hypothetical protein
MNKQSAKLSEAGLRREYNLSQLKASTVNIIGRRPPARTLSLIEPDLADLFPDSSSVNRALRLLADAARAATGLKRRRRVESDASSLPRALSMHDSVVSVVMGPPLPRYLASIIADTCSRH